MKFKILELTKENQEMYIDKIVDLENNVLQLMESQGKKGQLFTTGKEDILEYAKSSKDTVLCAVGEDNQLKSTTYITQGQDYFTYNDITKYFKFGSKYKDYIKQVTGESYRLRMLHTYSTKLKAYEHAKQKILNEYPEFESIQEFMKHEKESKNEFDEKSILREKMNAYMFEYIKQIGAIKDYEQFYWVTSEDIFEELNKKVDKDTIKNPNISEYDNFLKNESLTIHSNNIEDTSKYFEANPSNSIEIDTYITDPNCRHSGLARILVYEGIKKHIKSNFENTENDAIYLCSTLHKDNLSSKYVSEFFGLKDNIFVKRRTNRDREVHICKIERENYKDYLNDMQDKLIVLYGYNPENKKLPNQRVIQILEEQLEYEKNEYYRLNKIRNSKKDYTGNLHDIETKLNKMGKLKNLIKELKTKAKEGDER